MKTLAEKVQDFKNFLEDERITFFSCGNDEDDYDVIVNTLKANGGYWAGEKYRYYFDEDLNFVDVEERVFGR